ncbi:MAG: hypothetical protein K1Y36_27760 [Blastocatellia bacterium]|nr:hypothetical protein [Blastocatellia bacterium]
MPQEPTGNVTVELDGNMVRELSLAPHFPALVLFPSAITNLHNHNGESFSATSKHPVKMVIEALVPRQLAFMTAFGAPWVEPATDETIVIHLSQVTPERSFGVKPPMSFSSPGQLPQPPPRYRPN